VLESIIFPYYDSLTEEQKEEFIFIEDRAKVHKGHARLLRLNKGICGFDWPPSSLELNPVKKVWWWIKHEMLMLECVPTTIKDIKEVLTELWSQVKPKE
jgi:hypothetical protein